MPTVFCVNKAPNHASRVSSGSTKKMASTCAWDVGRSFLIQEPNSRAAVAGPASTNLQAPMASMSGWI